MITLDESIRFDRLRQRLMRAIAYELSVDGHCKSTEGTFEVVLCFPDYFQDEIGTAAPDYVAIRLYCYVLGPHRHYEWTGASFLEALRKAEAEIDSWIEHQKEDRND